MRHKGGATSVPTRRRVRIALREAFCKSCGICVEMCPSHVFATMAGTWKAVVSAAERCTLCGLCELYCPDYAISLEKE